MSVETARETMNYAGLEYKIIGDGAIVLRQVPEGMINVAKNATVILYTEEEENEESEN